MNLLFLLLAAALVLIAFAFILPPLWRAPPLHEADMNARNTALAKQRMVELKEQLAAGALSQSLYEEQLTELELSLSDDLDIAGTVLATSAQSRWIVYVLVLLIPIVASGLYLTLGNVPAIANSEELAKADPEQIQLEQITAMVGKLEDKLKKEPNNAEGWLMLGRSYKVMQQFNNAADAFEKAYKLLGDKPDVMLLYADALATAHNQQLAGKPAELVEKALVLEPENMDALWLGGMAKAQQGDAESAIALWRKLEAKLPPGSESLQQIQEVLAKVGAKPAAPKAASASGVAVEVEVSLALELKDKTAPEDTLFVYAKALSGPPMPLAIARKKVADLPLSVSLSDAMAMAPTMKLSNFKNVKLVARISKSGDAMTKPGDLTGEIASVSVADKTKHTLVINNQVK